MNENNFHETGAAVPSLPRIGEVICCLWSLFP